MGMCSEMLTAIHRMNAKAVFAPPEKAFADWLDQYDVCGRWQRATRIPPLCLLLSVSARVAFAISSRLAATGMVDLIARSRR
jgi:hypothetical protein